MNLEPWRQQLYPLGFLAAFIFGLRFLVQWIYSEKQQRSVVPKAFWRLSLLGNLLLFLHSVIQLQFHVALVQCGNGVISWRNLNLMQHRDRHWHLRSLYIFLSAAAMVTTAIIYLQIPAESNSLRFWFRIPPTIWNRGSTDDSAIWHLIGFIALLLFNCRFWMQWWHAEQTHLATLTELFWWISLVGALLSIAYFGRIGDFVNLIGPLFGLLPYIRNLMLIKKNKGNIVELNAP